MLPPHEACSSTLEEFERGPCQVLAQSRFYLFGKDAIHVEVLEDFCRQGMGRRGCSRLLLFCSPSRLTTVGVGCFSWDSVILALGGLTSIPAICYC